MISAGALKLGLSAAQDLIAALRDHLADMGEDEQVVADGLAIAVAIDPALAPLEIVAPALEFALAWIVANNRQGRPGSQTPMFGSGARGGANAGGRIDEEDGA